MTVGTKVRLTLPVQLNTYMEVQKLNRNNRWLIALVLAATLSSALAGCSSAGLTSAGHDSAMPTMAPLPGAVQTSPVRVQEAYQFAFANPDILKHIPCYCGCKDLLHTSNEDCYVKLVDAAGRITYDPHALNCQVCVDITQDVMRLTREGQSPGAIKTYIDRNYSRFGPSNMN